MRLGEIDLNKEPMKPSYFLCKPDMTVISPLKDIYNDELSVKISVVNELSFTIPSQVERNREIIDNPLIDRIKHRYLIKMVFNHVTEYFVFLNQNKTYSENDENIGYKAYGLGYLLADKSIRSWEAESKTLREMTTEILQTTSWKINYVDAEFELKYRSHSIASQTALQAVYEIAEKFNAAIIWNTVHKEINFYQPANIGLNKGLKFKEGKYLESFNIDSNSEEMVTRLRVYGKDGLTFRNLTPTGSNYLEDFSWFMYPFARNSEGVITASSEYMSDGLCIAIEDYTKILADSQGGFDTLYLNLTEKQKEVQAALQALSLIQIEYIIIMDELDVLNSESKADTPEHVDVIARRVAKEAEINVKMEEIKTLEDEETAIKTSIDELRVTLSMDSNFTREQILELDAYVIEKEYTNDTIVEVEDLLENGLEAFNKLRLPKINISMDIVNFLTSLESQNDWDKLTLGDIVKIESRRLKVGIEAKIIEINYNFGSDSISLVIANEADLKDDHEKLLDLIYSANSTSTIVDMDKYKWDMIEEANGMVSQIMNNTWETVKRNITAGYKQDIQITERGLIAKSVEDPMSWLVLQNGMLSITNDNGNTWKQSINKDGIVAERIIGKLIMGNRLIIEDENGIIRLSGSIQEIFDREGIVKVALGEFAPDKYGLKINDGAIDLSTDDAPDSGLKLDKSGIRTFSPTGKKTFEVDSVSGVTSVIGSLNIKSTDLVNRGVVLDGDGIRGYKLDGVESFKIDNSGNASFGGELKAASGTFTGTLSGVDGSFSGTLTGAIIKGGTIEGANGYFGTITGGSVTGISISSASIDITDSMTVGQKLTIGKGFDASEKGIYFKGAAVSVTAYGDTLKLDGMDIMMNGRVTFNSTVSGLYPVFG